MDLVDVLDCVCVDPYYGDDVEEDSAFAEESDVGEDGGVDLGEEVLDDGVVGLECFRITFAEVGID